MWGCDVSWLTLEDMRKVLANAATPKFQAEFGAAQAAAAQEEEEEEEDTQSP